jgi:hypothetical protein
MVNLHLREVRELPNPIEVRCYVDAQLVRQGWSMHGVHPGTYDYEVDTKPSRTRGRIVVTATGTNSIEF